MPKLFLSHPSGQGVPGPLSLTVWPNGLEVLPDHLAVSQRQGLMQQNILRLPAVLRVHLAIGTFRLFGLSFGRPNSFPLTGSFPHRAGDFFESALDHRLRSTRQRVDLRRSPDPTSAVVDQSDLRSCHPLKLNAFASEIRLV